MGFRFTPTAAAKLQAILAEREAELALSIEIGREIGRREWKLRLVRRPPDCLIVNDVPVVADQHTLARLEGLVFDWVITPDGPGLGVYDRNLVDRDLKHGT